MIVHTDSVRLDPIDVVPDPGLYSYGFLPPHSARNLERFRRQGLAVFSSLSTRPFATQVADSPPLLSDSLDPPAASAVRRILPNGVEVLFSRSLVHNRAMVRDWFRDIALAAVGKRCRVLIVRWWRVAPLWLRFVQARGSGKIAAQLILAYDDLGNAGATWQIFRAQPHRTDEAYPYVAFAMKLTDHNQPLRAQEVLEEASHVPLHEHHDATTWALTNASTANPSLIGVSLPRFVPLPSNPLAGPDSAFRLPSLFLSIGPSESSGFFRPPSLAPCRRLGLHLCKHTKLSIRTEFLCIEKRTHFLCIGVSRLSDSSPCADAAAGFAHRRCVTIQPTPSAAYVPSSARFAFSRNARCRSYILSRPSFASEQVSRLLRRGPDRLRARRTESGRRVPTPWRSLLRACPRSG